jgi:hypothetical protein
MEAEATVRRSRWPLGLALALAAMIAASLSVLGIALAHPDAEVVSHPLATGGVAPRAAD